MAPFGAKAAVVALSSWVSAIALLLKEPQNPLNEDANYVTSHVRQSSSREEFSYRAYQPPPNGGWESLQPSDRPNWWRPEGSVLPPSGAKVALAFRGHYHRYSATGFKHCGGEVCSDYWVNKDNIASSIVSPLIAAGAEVRVYFHTFSDVACTRYDKKLVQELKPHKYEFEELDEDLKPNYSHTYVQVLNAVIEDDWADFALLLRFDVQYNAPMTAWSITWSNTDINVPFFEPGNHEQNSDLMITIPKKWFSQFLAHLQEGCYLGMTAVKIKTWPEIGSHVRAIDENFMPSSDTLGGSFLGIVRECSVAYDTCLMKHRATTGGRNYSKRHLIPTFVDLT